VGLVEGADDVLRVVRADGVDGLIHNTEGELGGDRLARRVFGADRAADRVAGAVLRLVGGELDGEAASAVGDVDRLVGQGHLAASGTADGEGYLGQVLGADGDLN